MTVQFVNLGHLHADVVVHGDAKLTVSAAHAGELTVDQVEGLRVDPPCAMDALAQLGSS